MSFLPADQMSAAAEMLQQSFTSAVEGGDTPPDVPPSPPVEQTDGGEEPRSAEPESPTITVKDEDGTELTVDATEQEKGYLRHSTATKKFMEAAEMRKEALAIIEKVKEREAALNNMLSDEREVERYLTYLRGGQPGQQAPQTRQPHPQPRSIPNFDPNMPATLGEVEQLAQMRAYEQAQVLAEVQAKQMAQLRQQLQQEQIDTIRALEQQKAAMGIQGQLEAAVQHVVNELPLLQVEEIGELTDTLCAKAQKMDPSSVEEAIAFIRDLATQKHDRLKEKALALTKQREVEKAKLTTGGIVPPGGQAPANVAPPKKHELGTKEFQADAAQYLQSLLASRR